MPIRLLLVDDQALFREGLHTLLTIHEEVQVVGEAANGEEALQLVAQLTPDVVLMDVRMPVLDGVAAARQICRDYPASRVILHTTFEDDEHVFEGLRAGAAGYLLKDVSSDKLLEGIRAAAGKFPATFCEEPRHQHPGQTGRARPDAGGAHCSRTGHQLVGI